MLAKHAAARLVAEQRGERGQDGPRPPGLPLPARPLVGREREVAAVRRRLAAGDVRLLTLTGPGGIGKTRLALEVAAGLMGAFPAGAIFVDLAQISDPALVASAIAHALGLTEAGGRPPAEALRRTLRERRLLLVLDNFEHLLPAATLVGELLATCPALKVLATSRAALRLSGEHEFAVPPLALPPPWWSLGRRPPSPAALAGYEAVALFAQRARAAKADFRLTEANGRTVAEICARLDGLPLAIELAAARVKHLPPAALLARLGRRLTLLVGGARDLPARQQTLRDTIGWGYALLEPGEQRLLARLAVFVGGWTLEAAEAVAAEGEVVDRLATLVDGNLVLQEGGGPPDEPGTHPEVPRAAFDGASPGGPPSNPDLPTASGWGEHEAAARFGMLESIREFALERLAEGGDLATIRRRHAAYFLALGARAQPELRGPHQAAWLARLEAEHGNLRAAVEWWVEQAQAPAQAPAPAQPSAAEGALRLGGALWRFWWVRGYLREGREWLAQVLALPHLPVPTPGYAEARAEAAFGAGVLALAAGDTESARALFEDCRAEWRAAGDTAGLACALLSLGEVDLSLGAYASARVLLECSAAAFRERGDRQGLPWSLSSLGYVAHEQGDAAAARAALEESAALFRERGDRTGLAQGLYYLALVADDQGRPEAAWPLYQESLAIRRELGERAGIAQTLEGLAALAAAAGWPESAAHLAGAAAALREATGAWLPAPRRTRLERRLTPAREALGEVGFATARAHGEQMPLAEALAEATPPVAPDLAVMRRPGARSGTAAGRPGDTPSIPLSPREREVATLVAQGLTNRQIGERLIITRGTASIHVEHILDKLGLQSRVQVAAWAVEHGLHTLQT